MLRMQQRMEIIAGAGCCNGAAHSCDHMNERRDDPEPVEQWDLVKNDPCRGHPAGRSGSFCLGFFTAFDEDLFRTCSVFL